MEEIEEKNLDNVWAFDIENNEKHISWVERGRKGYYCRGCNYEMEAVKGEVRPHYFRHVPRDIESKLKCMRTDETFRHDYAKKMLDLHKQIKVPSVWKLPPTEMMETHKANKLKDARIIKADRVEIEMTFFEDQDGIVRWGKAVDFDEKYNRELLIIADAAFFDANNKPLLIIEIAATHKIDATKLYKIRRLGIDTVEVLVPVADTKEIEETFNKVSRTKWIYNNEQEQANYIPVPKGSDSGISSSDDIPGYIPEPVESFACKSSQIRSFIRRINKIVGSDQYRESRNYFTGEIKRVEENTGKESEEWAEIEGAIEKEIEGEILEEFRERRESVEDRRKNLEGRYRSKAGEIADTENKIEQTGDKIIELESKIGKFGTAASTYEDRIAEIERRRSAIETRRAELSAIRTGFEEHKKQIRESIDAKFAQRRSDVIAAIQSRDCKRSTPVRPTMEKLIDAAKSFQNSGSLERIKRAQEFFESEAWKNRDQTHP